MVRAAKGLSPATITTTIEKRYDLAIDVESMSASLNFFQHEYDGPKKEEYISHIEAKIKKAQEELSNTVLMPPLAALKAVDEEGVTDDVEWLILETIKYFDVSKSAILEYTRDLAYELLIRFSTLTLEDLIVCFQKAKDGEYGELYNRLDGNVVNGWLQKYSGTRDEIDFNRKTSRHMALKAGNNDGRIQAEDPRKLMEEAKTKLMIENARKK